MDIFKWKDSQYYYRGVAVGAVKQVEEVNDAWVGLVYLVGDGKNDKRFFSEASAKAWVEERVRPYLASAAVSTGDLGEEQKVRLPLVEVSIIVRPRLAVGGGVVEASTVSDIDTVNTPSVKPEWRWSVGDEICSKEDADTGTYHVLGRYLGRIILLVDPLSGTRFWRASVGDTSREFNGCDDITWRVAKNWVEATVDANEGVNQKENPTYDPPMSYEQAVEKLGEETAKELLNSPARLYRFVSGIELVHPEPTLDEQIRIWENWQLMSDEQKSTSDCFSMVLFGKTNERHHNELMKRWFQPPE